MAAFLFRLMTLLALVLGAEAASAAAAGPHVAMRLVAESATPAGGTRVTLAISATPAAGWHGYWRNPGDAGLETQADWTLPAGVTVGPLRYPVPERLIVAGLANYVYEKPFAVLVDVAIPAGLAKGTRLPVSVKLDYLVCTTQICVPETQTLATTLTVGDGATTERERFDAWRRALPRPLGLEATYQVANGRFRLSVPLPAAVPIESATFFPARAGVLDMAAAQTIARDGDRLIVETKAAATPTGGPVEGVLATGGGDGLALAARPGMVAAKVEAPTAGGGWRVALLAFAGAVLGGLILNVMPCVFPILSLKALSLAKSGGAGARGEALAYTAGVVLVCVGLGAALLAIRAGGSAAGWAFQLQDPRVIGVLLLLVVGIAFNLAGLFELPTPRFAGEGGAGGAFATGALAAFVATPCTGPFMGAALGAALVLPTAAALLVFAGLGLGIALPFLLIGFVPALRRRLPRPGAWMATLRRVLSVPMFATALGLAWVLGRQAGVDALTLALTALLVAVTGLWWTGRRQIGGRDRAWAPGLIGVTVAAVGLVMLRAAPSEATVAVAGNEPFSEARLAALRAEGRPVFAYFTADWCLTCKVNEKAAIERTETMAAFKAANVAVLVGDWTAGDPTLGRFIEQHNRAGVPLYLWYAPGSAAPRILPQVLTIDSLTTLVTGLPRS